MLERLNAIEEEKRREEEGEELLNECAYDGWVVVVW